MEVNVFNVSGDIVEKAEISDYIFAGPVNVPLMHQAIMNHLQARRVGTSSTKTRAEVARTGAKLFRQKGTGRSRQGSKKAPHWVGGGVAFGPKPRYFSNTFPRKILCAASLRSAVSSTTTTALPAPT